MNIDTRLFRSILARRFFALFVISALLPIVILSSVAYWRVSQELLEQSEYRLHHAARSVGLSISERLGFLDTELGSALQIVAPDGVSRSSSGPIHERMHKLFNSLAVVSADGEISWVFGEGPAPPPLAIDAKSPWTAGHSERVTAMSLKIAQALGRSRSQLEVLHRGALLHDVGKLGISVQLLDKPGKLEDHEFKEVKAHPSIGGRILEPISAFADIMPIVTDHHERWDGKGYPNGLAGEEIHINARILAVADTYDAMTSDRPYRKGRGTEAAVEEIWNQAGTQLDPRVVEAFLVAMGRDFDYQVAQKDRYFLGDVAGRGA